MGNFISFCNPKDDSTQNNFDNFSNFGNFNDFTNFDDFGKLINQKLLKDGITDICQRTLLLISIVLNGYDNNKNYAMYNFYMEGYNTNTIIKCLDDLLKEEEIDDENKSKIVDLFLQLINFKSKNEKRKCWKISKKMLSKDPILDFIWKEIENKLEDRFCGNDDCDYMYSQYGYDLHRHCKECDSTKDDTDDDYLPYCSKCVPYDYVGSNAGSDV